MLLQLGTDHIGHSTRLLWPGGSCSASSPIRLAPKFSSASRALQRALIESVLWIGSGGAQERRIRIGGSGGAQERMVWTAISHRCEQDSATWPCQQLIRMNQMRSSILPNRQ